jgi:hypothetical protein
MEQSATEEELRAIIANNDVAATTVASGGGGGGGGGGGAGVGSAGGAPVAIVVEDRSRPVRMKNKAPALWASRGVGSEGSGGSGGAGQAPAVLGSAQPGELYTFQLALLLKDPNGTALTVSSVTFTDLVGTSSAAPPPAPASAVPSISAADLHCMNTNGTDYWGRVYSPVNPVVIRCG